MKREPIKLTLLILSLFCITISFIELSEATDVKEVINDKKNITAIERYPMIDQTNASGSETNNTESLIVTSDKKCIYCYSTMPAQANVCSKCRMDQRWYLNYFRIGDFLLMISLLISLGMMYFSHLNYKMAKSENIKASEAVERADKALIRASAVEDMAKKLQADIQDKSDEVVRLGSGLHQFDIEITKTNSELTSINQRVEESSHGVSRLKEKIEQLTLIRIIKHEKSSILTEDLLRGQVHRIMGPYTLTLPPAKVGLWGAFGAGVNEVFSVKPSEGESIRLNLTPLVSGNKVTSLGEVGAKINFVCYDNGVWDAISSTAIFIDGGR